MKGWGLMLACAAFAGCGDESGGAADAAVPDAAPPPAGDTYRAGMEREGARGHATVRLVDALPAPPDLNDNRWVLEVEADGTLMTGCALVVTPVMPAHGHGTAAVEVEEKADGSYTAKPLTLFMPGLWVITIDVTCGTMSDTAVYEFWIEG